MQNDTVCAASTVSYTVPAVANADSYYWDIPATVQIVSGQGSNSITLQFPTTSTEVLHTISVAAVNSCDTGLQRSFTTLVRPLVTSGISIQSSVTNICAGTSVTFTATSTNGGTNPQYQWKRSGVNVGTNSSTYSSNV